jgi:DNA invertase Pin-like site-specific DNA recombinase
MGVLALIAEFENDIRHERQMDGITKARERGIRFGRKPILIPEVVQNVRKLRKGGKTVPQIMKLTNLSKASIYRALAAGSS